ncbi:uncharacterized protein LOC133521201 [Cydia pomonella]|uniref:uncharacterized protein LOC133521201 n=1 Tax=Cydia pomonella TaxID=82600 RepID=UPI002ADDD68E|nr:uncharacterized protein LOC133521201 [Cydia pomonella]
MVVKITLLLCLAYTVSGEHDKVNKSPPLGWPSEYRLEATKRFVSTGYTSHIKYWRSIDIYTRLDVNDDFSRIYVGHGYGTRYQIWYNRNKTRCHKEKGTRNKPVRIYKWLPYFNEFEATGYETINGIRCAKFTEKTRKRDKNILWAYSNNTTRTWVPLRYKKRSNDTNHGSLNDHVIYDYFNFKTIVNREVYNIYKNYACTTAGIWTSENTKSDMLESKDETLKNMKVTDEGFIKKISRPKMNKIPQDLETSGHKSRSTGNVHRPYFLKRIEKRTNIEELVPVKNDELPPLKWPTKYSIEATKLYLTSGWTEHFKYWRFTILSRLDANNGAVTQIRVPIIKEGYKVDFEIHPETTEEQTNEKVCYQVKDSDTDPDELEEPIYFLPTTGNLEEVGKENIKGVECVKFTGSYDQNDKEVTNEELWAYYNHSAKSWVPVRYETRTSDSRHGYLKDHQIIDYFNFSPKVNIKVFNLFEKYTCIKIGYDDDDDQKKVPTSNNLESMTAQEKKELDEAFAEYKQKFNKQYAHLVEHEMRKSIFHEKWRLITETNRKNLSYTLALNKMSDRTKKELKRYKGLRRDKPRSVGNIRFPYSHEEIKKISETLPSYYDLRLEGVVGPVLDQDSCGSCWAFGTTAAVEGALARSKGGMLISLSNQALLDCSWGMGNSGCDGGNDISAYKWIMKHGLPTVAEYGPYSKQDGYCNIKNMTTTYKIRGWTDVTPLSEEALKIALINHGPLSVSIDAEDAFLYYDGGILYDTKCKSSTDDMNHEVTLVGYGEKDGESYWIIRNSYGPYWGIDGYVHISTRDNNCGVMTEPTYVVVE